MWILGDSIPFWAGKRARDTGKPNLRIRDVTIDWLGVRGLGWKNFRHHIEAKVLFSSPPSIIFIHLGGNDLTSASIVQIKRDMREDINYLREAFPDVTIIWIDILPRRVWSGAQKTEPHIDNKRVRLNRIGRQLVSKEGKFDLIKPDIDTKTGFFRPDGIHLNDVGLEFYMDYLRDAIIRNI